ncbi:MAG: hypothetical protein ACI9CE_003749 [Flavobacterium sp.]|jgi:hypothetical protein
MGGVPKISRQWPDQYPVVAYPAQFTLIGSRSNQYSHTIAFKSSSLVAEAKESFEETLKENGWTTPQGMRAHGGGFQAKINVGPKNIVSFCHDDHGHLSGYIASGPNLFSAAAHPERCEHAENKANKPHSQKNGQIG